MIECKEPRCIGSEDINGITSKELMAEFEQILPVFEKINLSCDVVDPNEYKKIIRGLVILRYSEDRFPYMVKLSFLRNGKVKSAELINDPQFDPKCSNHSFFRGQVLGYPNLFELNRNSKLFINGLRALASNSHDNGYALNKNVEDIYLAGTVDRDLVFGHAKK